MSKNTTKYFLPPDFLGQQSLESWEYPLQINSGAIDASGADSGWFNVQAITAKGSWNFYGILKSDIGEDEIREFLEGRQFLEGVEQRHRPRLLPWNTRSAPTVIWTDVATKSTTVWPSSEIERRVADDEEVLVDWRSSASELLVKLFDVSTGRDELFEAILFTEIANFDESQTKQLLTRLFAFVSEYRLSQDEDVKTAVGAAIRKLAMNLQDSQIEQYADLFPPTETDTLPCEIELELAKAVLWRLTATPASLSREFPRLESRLAELASDYLKRRLILQKNYASVALQATLGVFLLNGQHADSILNKIKDLGINWFTELLQRRLARLRKELAGAGDAVATSVVMNLERFESQLQGASD